MKQTLLLPLALAFTLIGCGDSSNQTGGSTNAASSGSPITAPVDYLNSAAKAKQSMEKTVDVTSINKAIELFNAQEGRFPENLDELVAKKYLAQIPTPPFGTKIEYDPKTGAAKIVKQ
jgi:hypothetical protein